MDLIKHFFQDASNACAYANECAPDLSFLKPTEPFTALFAIAALCYLLWAWNERRIARRASPQTLEQLAASDTSQLKETLGVIRNSSESRQKLAA